ncbi:ABC transporter ATP-binding protein [Oenococcus sp. UCMA 16435]|nr:ABC transporter ATP-binding protein [Oenococcus sp. UCMA 16435]MDI4584882.1 ATP-binding cassette domain-containing protein [Oenococcus sp. UCMA 14587]
MMTKILHIEHLQKKFGNFEALKDISFDVNSGEVFGFIGPNGAGKSTTIRIILGLLRKTSGSVEVFGEDAFKRPVEIHRKLVYVPGDIYLWPNLTGGETIDLLLKMGGHQHNKKTDLLIERFELDISKKNRSYSKGNRQKVALIAALSADANLYIFDEPTSGLDPLQELNFQKSVLELKEDHKAVLLSSHILSEVEKMVDRLAIIRKGEIIETGYLNDLQHLSALNIRAEVKSQIGDFSKIKGVGNFRQNQKKIAFSANRQDLPSIMARLSALSPSDLQVTQPTLEELFMHFYDSAGKENENAK